MQTTEACGSGVVFIFFERFSHELKGLNRSYWDPPKYYDGSEYSWPTSRLRALSYVVGVLLKGDGCVHESKIRPAYLILLKVKSKRFVEKFRADCSVVLRRRPVKVHGPAGDGCWRVCYGCRDFVRWWKAQNLEEFKPLTRRFPHEYLQGRFDSEANVHNYEVYLMGAEDHTEVMEWDRELCMRLGMRVGRLLPHNEVGNVSFIGKRKIVSTERSLRFSVNVRDYLDKIGGLNVESRDAKLKSMVKGRQWTEWSADVRRKALSMWSEGRLNPNEISKKLSEDLGQKVPALTVYFWLKKGTITWKEYKERALSTNV